MLSEGLDRELSVERTQLKLHLSMCRSLYQLPQSNESHSRGQGKMSRDGGE